MSTSTGPFCIGAAALAPAALISVAHGRSTDGCEQGKSVAAAKLLSAGAVAGHPEPAHVAASKLGRV